MSTHGTPAPTNVMYSRTHGAWLVRLETGRRATPYRYAAHDLAVAMAVAQRDGTGLEGCTCPQEQAVDQGPLAGGWSVQAPHTHPVGAWEGTTGTVLVIGHGSQRTVDTVDGGMREHSCPLENPDGEATALAMLQQDADGRAMLDTRLEPFPFRPAGLQPLEGKRPKAYEGPDVAAQAGHQLITMPGRHLHPQVREALEGLNAAGADVADLSRKAHEAEAAAQAVKVEAQRAVQAAVLARQPGPDVAALIRQRREAAEVARILADGTQAALTGRVQEVRDTVDTVSPEWRQYLATQGGHSLARLDKLATELDEALTDLATLDTHRAALDSKGTLGGHSLLAHQDITKAVQDFRSRAAEALASLSPHQ